MNFGKIVITAILGFSLATTVAVASDQSNDSSDRNKSFTQSAADHVESAGKGTWVQPATDAAADKIRSYDKGNSVSR